MSEYPDPIRSNMSAAGNPSADESAPSQDQEETNVPHAAPDPQSNALIQALNVPEIYRSPTSIKLAGHFLQLATRFGMEQITADMIEGYRRNVIHKDPMPAPTLRRLTQHMDSVALLGYKMGDKIDIGTFFLLTDSLGLTCHHVLKPVIEMESQLVPVSILFNYESESSEWADYTVQVEFYNEDYDFAFLRISEPTSRKGLLDFVAPPPQDGAVSIIGHPGGSFKKIDPMCSVINLRKRDGEDADAFYSSYLHIMTKNTFVEMYNPKLVAYDTCLYWGASGAPVFNNQGDLVAVHSGGYLVDTNLKKKSIVEYGVNIADILIIAANVVEDLKSWAMERGRRQDSMTGYLNSYIQSGGHSENMMIAINGFKQFYSGWKLPLTENPSPGDSETAEASMDTS